MPNRLFIRREAGVPLYRQLREALAHEISTGLLDPEQALPSSRQLAAELGISRNTVNAAYLELEAEGFVEVSPRRGYFVNRELIGELQVEHQVREQEAFDWSRHITLPEGDLPEPYPQHPHENWRAYPYPFIDDELASPYFPRLAWMRALRQAMDPSHIEHVLEDRLEDDDPFLVEAIRHRVLPVRGIEASAQEVLVIMNSHEGLDLLARSVVRRGTPVGVEDPGYPLTRQVFQRYGASLKLLPVDSDGLIVDHLEDLALIYCTPSHQIPTNVTMPVVRRRKLLRIAREQNTIIVEDDFDSELRFGGRMSPALRAFPESEHIVYMGTFSKFLAPGRKRIGYLVGSAELIAALKDRRKESPRLASGHLQHSLALYLQSADFLSVARRRRTSLASRWTRLREALEQHMPFEIDMPAGGTSIWVEGPPGFDADVLAARSLEEGIVFESGGQYFHTPEARRNCFRLGFTAIETEAIPPGVRILGRLAEEELRRSARRRNC